MDYGDLFEDVGDDELEAKIRFIEGLQTMGCSTPEIDKVLKDLKKRLSRV